MKRHFSLIIFLLVTTFSGAQELRQYEFLQQKHRFGGDDTLNHASVQDLFYFRPITNPSDEVGKKTADRLRSFLIDKLSRDNLVIINRPGYLITADPLFDVGLGRETVGAQNSWLNTRGVQAYGRIELGKKDQQVDLVDKVDLVEELESQASHTHTHTHTQTQTPYRPHALKPFSPSFEFYTSYYESQGRFPDFVDSLASISGGIPGQGSHSLINHVYDHSYSSGWVRYHANRYFTFEAGTGKNFFGNGYRSLILSDNSRNYPYFRIDTKLWRFHNTNLWAEFRDNAHLDGPLGTFQKKYGAFHYLSYSITNRLEISLFEAIIWQGRDSLHNRGFELNYLNPVIFLRPVEWSLGSPDNALAAINLSYRFFTDTYMYGQFLVDDLPLAHVKARDGFWGNKIAGQIGAKTFIPLGHWSPVTGHSRGLFLQSELNFAKPYTYAHWTSKQNYGHMGQPLAHPLGANFVEWVNFARLHWDRFLLEGRYSLAKFGANYNGLNYGQDIFLSFDSRVNEFGNFIGQGLATTLTYKSLTASYLINASSLLNIFVTVTDRRQVSTESDNHSLWVTFGIRNSLRNFYYDY